MVVNLLQSGMAQYGRSFDYLDQFYRQLQILTVL